VARLEQEHQKVNPDTLIPPGSIGYTEKFLLMEERLTEQFTYFRFFLPGENRQLREQYQAKIQEVLSTGVTRCNLEKPLLIWYIQYHLAKEKASILKVKGF